MFISVVMAKEISKGNVKDFGKAKCNFGAFIYENNGN